MNINRRFFLGGVAATVAIPIAGPVAMSALAPEPAADFLPCWGQAVSRAQYAKLFEVIGKTYGAPDNDTFSLPDLRRRFVAGGNYGGSVGVLDQTHRHMISTSADACHTHSFTAMELPAVVALDSVISTGVGTLLPAGFIAEVAGKLPLA